MTRRDFHRFAAAIAAGGAVPTEHAFAQLGMARGTIPPDAVLINANENPLGPCAEAREAIRRASENGGRYQYGEAFAFARTLAQMEGVPESYVCAFAGSSDPLNRAVIAFTGPDKPLLTGDPSYELAEMAAHVSAARVVRVPLTPTYAIDVKAMVKHGPAGAYYICSPNNPTGTITPKSDIEWLLANKPAGSVVIVDEAYLHFAKQWTPCTDLVAKDKDIVVLRTFSKLYGMAGIRAGAVVARPDLLERITRYGVGPMPAAGMAGATASLLAKNIVTERRNINAAILDDVLEFLDRHRFSFVRSDSNKFMVDVKRPGREIQSAMAREKVYIGRVWPTWPTHVRVTVGTREDMTQFKAAFLKVMS